MYTEDLNEILVNCREMMLNFFKNTSSSICLNLIINVYEELRYSEINKPAARQKFLKVLYNLKQSNSLYSILEKSDREILNIFLEDFLMVEYDEKGYYIGNEFFCNLSLDELYDILIETKYAIEKENITDNRLSI